MISNQDNDGGEGAGGNGDEERQGEGSVVVETAKPEFKRPPMYKVLLLNDDFTPMDFVVEVLEHFFGMNRAQATRIMLTVHTQGRAVCGIYSRDVAETKSAQVIDYARRAQHPLMSQTEPA